MVARINDYAESSAVVVLITSELGAVRAVAKGARRVANSFRGPLDRGVLYRVRVGRRGGEGLHHLYASEVVEAYPALRRDPARFHAASLMLEVADDLMSENEPHPELFRLTVFTLKVIDRAPLDRLPLVVTFGLARAVALSGHVPEIEHCVACGARIERDQRPLLSEAHGGVLHPGCADGEPGARSVSPGVLELLRTLWERSSAETLATRPQERTLRELRSLLTSWLVHTLERRFRSVPGLERELARLVAP